MSDIATDESHAPQPYAVVIASSLKRVLLEDDVDVSVDSQVMKIVKSCRPPHLIHVELNRVELASEISPSCMYKFGKSPNRDILKDVADEASQCYGNHEKLSGMCE